MKLKKVTVLDSCRNVYAAVIEASTWADLGAFWCPPNGSPGGTVIKLELVLEVPNSETADYPTGRGWIPGSWLPEGRR